MQYAIFQPTPIENVEDIKKFIANRVVYDLGAGRGDWAKAMEKYAKKVVAVEEDPFMVGECEDKGLNIIADDFMKIDLKEAKVIYIFMSYMGNYNLYRKILKENWHGTVISALYPLGDYAGEGMSPNRLIHSKQVPFLIYEL